MVTFNKMKITKKVIIRVVADCLAIGIVGIAVLILFVVAKPFHRGFYCDDESLMHPYKKNTIPTWLAGFIGFALPTASLLILEAAKARSAKNTLQLYLTSCYQLLMPFFFGGAVSQLTTDIAKYSIGRLRPHFLSVCKPNITCTINTGFVERDVCTGTDLDAIEEARLSFPSGHSAVSFYCMVWIIVYLQYKFTWKRYWLIRPLLQSFCFFLAYYTGLSRISDYMHHWSDVLSGAIIGTTIACFNIFFMSNLLPWRHDKCEECSKVLPMHSQVTSQSASKDNGMAQD